jgi:hypothetical protein
VGKLLLVRLWPSRICFSAASQPAEPLVISYLETGN